MLQVVLARTQSTASSLPSPNTPPWARMSSTSRVHLVHMDSLTSVLKCTVTIWARALCFSRLQALSLPRPMPGQCWARVSRSAARILVVLVHVCRQGTRRGRRIMRATARMATSHRIVGPLWAPHVLVRINVITEELQLHTIYQSVKDVPLACALGPAVGDIPNLSLELTHSVQNPLSCVYGPCMPIYL